MGRDHACNLIRELIDEGRESEDLDYKEALDLVRNEGRKELAKDMAAFANSRGGHILVGVRDRTFELVGVNPQDMDSAKIHQIADSIHPPVIITSDLVRCDERSFLLITIEKDSKVHETQAGKVPYRSGEITVWAAADRIAEMKRLEYEASYRAHQISRGVISGESPIKLFLSHEENVYDVDYNIEGGKHILSILGKPTTFRPLLPARLRFWFLQRVIPERSVKLQVGAKCKISYGLKRRFILDGVRFDLGFILLNNERDEILAKHKMLEVSLEGPFPGLERRNTLLLKASSHYDLAVPDTLYDYTTTPGHEYYGGLYGELGLSFNARITDESGMHPLTIELDEFEWADY